MAELELSGDDSLILAFIGTNVPDPLSKRHTIQRDNIGTGSSTEIDTHAIQPDAKIEESPAHIELRPKESFVRRNSHMESVINQTIYGDINKSNDSRRTTLIQSANSSDATQAPTTAIPTTHTTAPNTVTNAEADLTDSDEDQSEMDLPSNGIDQLYQTATNIISDVQLNHSILNYRINNIEELIEHQKFFNTTIVTRVETLQKSVLDLRNLLMMNNRTINEKIKKALMHYTN